MGTAIPRNEIGTHCNNCFGIGGAWPGTSTPQFLYGKFYGWKPGDFYDAANEQILLSTQILQQTASPCVWAVLVGDLYFYWQFGPANTFGHIFPLSEPGDYFTAGVPEKCQLVLRNSQITPGSGAAYDGWFSVSWNPEDL
jgi:hypothetical protein